MKTFFKIFGALLALLIIAISIFLWTFDLNNYRDTITEKLSASLGHPVSIDRLEMKLALVPTIKASSIRIENPDTIQADKPLFFSTSAEVTLALAPLLSHRLEIQKVLFGTSFINLVEHNGQNNWSISSKNNTSSSKTEAHSDSSWLKDMRFDNIAFEKTTLIFNSDKHHFDAEITNASVKQLKLFSFSLLYDNQLYKVSGNGNDILQLLSGAPNYVFNLEFTHPTLTAKLNGNIGDTRKLQDMVFNFSVSSDNLKECAKKFRVKSTEIPAVNFDFQSVLQGNLNELEIVKFNLNLGTNKLVFASTGAIESITQTPQMTLNGTLTLSDNQMAQLWGLKPFSSRFELVATPTKIALNNLTLQANRSDIHINSEITNYMTRPYINSAISSELLNTADFLYQPQIYAPAPVIPTVSPARKISDKEWNLSFLQKFDGVIQFNLPHFKFNDNVDGYFGVEGNMTLKNGHIQTNSLKGTLLDGTFTGEADITVSDSNTSYQANLTAHNLNLNRIKQLKTILKDATLDVSLKADTSGNSAYQTLSHLNGQALVELSKGTIVSEWFNTIPIVEVMARQKTSALTFSNSDKISQILCGAAKIDIENGTLVSQNNIALETSSVNFQVGGSFNLLNEAMHIKIRPILNTMNEKINALLSAGRLVNITGTLSQSQLVLEGGDATDHLDALLKPTVLEPYALCQQVLNHQTLAQKKAAAQKNTVLSFPKEKNAEKPEAVKDPLRQQLLETLQDALKQ